MPLASATQVARSRLTRILLLIAALCLGAPTAGADAATPPLDNNLATLWTMVLETPSAQNPFGTGGLAFACWDLGGTVAPFAPVPVPSCKVKPGTKIFVATSFECSTFPGDVPGGLRLKRNYGSVPARTTCKKRPPSPSTVNPCR